MTGKKNPPGCGGKVGDEVGSESKKQSQIIPSLAFCSSFPLLAPFFHSLSLKCRTSSSPAIAVPDNRKEKKRSMNSLVRLSSRPSTKTDMMCICRDGETQWKRNDAVIAGTSARHTRKPKTDRGRKQNLIFAMARRTYQKLPLTPNTLISTVSLLQHPPPFPSDCCGRSLASSCHSWLR
jgi:hypothetical protein